MNFGVDKLFDVHPWQIVESSFNPEKAREAEACLSLSNEYMGCRGSFEEGSSGLTLEGCYIGGIYVRQPIVYETYRKAFPKESNFMVHTTHWFRTRIEVDGEKFSMDDSVFSDYRRVLDMQQGLLIRELVFTTAAGKKTKLRWERFLSHADRHLAASSLSVTALNHCSPVTVYMELDGQKENTHFGNARRHMVEAEASASADEMSLLKKIVTTGQYFRHQMKTEIPAEASVSYYQEDCLTGKKVDLNLEEGRTSSFSRTVSVFSSRDAGFPFGLIQKGQTENDLDGAKESDILDFLRKEGRAHTAAMPAYEQARAAHIEAVSNVWKTLDIEIEGDDLSQQGIRFCMFQLFSTYRGFDGNLNIGAKGLTGEVYFGRYFWDTEAYCLPYYLLTNPEAARHLLLCRYNTLDAARERARSFNYNGAWYAWQTIDGTEDLSLNEYAFGEVHIDGIVPYALAFYTKTTGSTELLYKEGIEILIEMSRFWASRASYNPLRKGYGILKVMGPDEYQQFVNNNFYTNFMARHALEYTLQVIDEMGTKAPEALADVFDRLHVKQEVELSKWKTVVDGMILNENEELGVFVQDDEILYNEEIHREELDKQRDIPVEHKWTIDKYQKAQLIKQPDVLMGLFLFRDRFSMQQKKDNFRFYEQRTIHGSSLSPSVHSILANEIGRYNMAYQYYLYAARLDLEDYNNNTFEGLHITSLAGTWLNMIFGFGGLCVADNHIQLSPNIPQAWKSLKFKVTYRGELMQVTATHDTVEAVVLDGERGIPVSLYGEQAVVGEAPKTVSIPEELRVRPQMQAVIFTQKEPVDENLIHEFHAAGIKTTTGTNFEQIAAQLEVVPRNCLVVADSFDVISGAAAAGIKTMGIGWKIDLYNADYVLKSTRYLTRERGDMLF